MRAPAASLLVASALVTACPTTNHVALAPDGGGATARVTEQHDFDDGHVFIWRVDGRKVRELNIWRRVDLEIDVPPGKHVLECAYTSTEMHSTQNAALPLLAEGGRVYIVKARGVKEGFWTELGKAFQSTVWPAKTTWVAWIEDASSGVVVTGVRPTREGLFSTGLPEPSPGAGGPDGPVPAR